MATATFEGEFAMLYSEPDFHPELFPRGELAVVDAITPDGGVLR